MLFRSLEAEIDQFYLKKEGEEPGELVVQVSDSKDEPDIFSGVHTPGLIIVRVDDSLKDEEDMALNRKKGLKELLAERNKGTSGLNLYLLSRPPSPLLTVSLLPIPNLKKKRKEKEIAEEGEVVP